MSDFFCNFAFFCLGFLMLLGLLFSMMSFIKFAQNIIDDLEDKKRCSSDSKDFRIDDPVVYNDHGDDYFTHINGVYSWEEKFCYSLEAVEFVVWSSWLRHPTQEELEKYFRK